MFNLDDEADKTIETREIHVLLFTFDKLDTWIMFSYFRPGPSCIKVGQRYQTDKSLSGG